MTTTESPKKIHHGRNVKRFRELFGLKQEALAIQLGQDWSQKKVSRLEEQEEIEEDILAEVAKVLKVPVEAIKHFDEQTAINIISNTFTDNHFAGYTVNNNPNFSESDKLLAAIEENKKLYEQLLASEKEKVAMLQKMLDQK